VEDGVEPDIASITSRILQRFTILQAPFDLDDIGAPEPILQAAVDATLAKYALEDLNMNVRCYERHVTTWDAPDW
jgi:citrate lyase gamma subunit